MVKHVGHTGFCVDVGPFLAVDGGFVGDYVWRPFVPRGLDFLPLRRADASWVAIFVKGGESQRMRTQIGPHGSWHQRYLLGMLLDAAPRSLLIPCCRISMLVRENSWYIPLE